LAALVKNRPNTILVVDAISALGGYPLPMDKWGIDILVAGSQKAMMLPPGLAFAALSPKAWEFVKTSTCPKYYFDFAKQLKSQQKNQTAYTSAVTLTMGLQQVMGWIREKGLEKIYAHNRRLSLATKAAVQAMGLELYRQAKSLGGAHRGPGPGRGGRAAGGGQNAGKGHLDRRRPGPGQGQNLSHRPYGLYRRTGSSRHPGGPGDGAQRT
jgi:selenocysteine lyase/cysteine desulfurase